jgi:endoglycosylceramidase
MGAARSFLRVRRVHRLASLSEPDGRHRPPYRVGAALRMALAFTVLSGAGIAFGGAAPGSSARPPPAVSRSRPVRAGISRRPATMAQYSPRPVASTLEGPGAQVTGLLSAPGGPDIFDQLGRVVTLHGVDAVYKRAPYELYPDPGHPWNFDQTDAARIAKLGFNVVRLGIEWEGLEPGYGSANSAGICRVGQPGNPREFNASIAHRYLENVAKTVDLLGRDGIYTLLDMHQDVYSRLFLGEGAPNWAVCTDGKPIVPVGGRWSRNYGNPTLAIAERHFWDNDVVGNLQGQFDQVWGTVAHYFRNNPWVLGYDPYNEPFSMEITETQRSASASALECFYTGTAHPAMIAGTGTPVSCPATDPTSGLIPTIEAADPHHLIFIEPDIYHEHGLPTLLEPMGFQHLVYNFHVYCPQRSAVTGNPTNLSACERHELKSILNNEGERSRLSSAQQPGGPAWFMSEFGATTDVALVSDLTKDADGVGIGWSYYSWKYYNDPTGSTSEALKAVSGSYSPIVGSLSRTYPQAVAGMPVSVSFDPTTGDFKMTYIPNAKSEPTSIFIAQSLHYPDGWCAAVIGGRITSAPGAPHLLVDAVGHPAQVSVTVTNGHCLSTN